MNIWCNMSDKKTFIINQSAGIGDIFFLMKIASTIAEMDYNIIWPIKKDIFYIKDYLVFHKNINFVKEEDVVRTTVQNNILDFENADRTFNDGSILTAKYRLAKKYGLNIEYEGWSKYLNIKRNYEKEKNLFYNVLGLKEGENYSLYNRNYGTPPFYKKKNNMKESELRKVEMFISNEYTIFDWLFVVENASEIHIVDSSLTYLIENLTLKTNSDNMHLYSRYTEEVGDPKWHHASDLFKKQWNYEDI